MTNWRALALRHLLGRLHIGDDVVRHLSTFQRLGETLEAVPPTEMLPVGARTLLRAVRTRAAAQIRPDWLWPHWLERQLDPHDPAFTPRGHLPVMQNVTRRNWTLVGNLDSPWEAIVDPTGLLTPWFDAWSLDWWVQDGGVWHLPARSGQLQQSLVDDAPVVATALRLEGGEVVQRVYAADEDGEDVAVVEIENATPRPVQVALAVRPYNPEGLAVVERIALRGDVVLVDGREGVKLPATPLGSLFGSFSSGDSVLSLPRGRWQAGDGEVTDHAGLAQAAFLFDVGPAAAVRAALPMDAPVRRRARVGGRTVVERVRPSALPSAHETAQRWREQRGRGLQVALPDERVQRAVEANRGFLLALHDPGDITAGPFTYHRFWFRDAAYQVAALSRWGFEREAADVLRSYPGRQQPDGFFYSQWREWDANGAAIWAVAEHHRLHRDDDLLEELASCVQRGAEWIVRTCANDRGKAPAAAGLLPAGVSAEHLGPFDYYYWDDLWAWRGLLDAAGIARERAEHEVAAASEHAAATLRETLLAAWERDAVRLGRTAVPAGPTRGVDAAMIGSLAACYPLSLLSADDAWVRGTLAAIREHLVLGDAFYQGISHTGLGTYLTLQLAFVELEAGDDAAWRRFSWLLDAATPTFTWPEAIHPQLPGGCMGDGHHGWTVADVLNFVRMLLVRETPQGLALLSALPPGWAGRDVEVLDAPTHHGRLSFHLTWKDEHPVLSWRLDGARRAVRLLAPGLDRGWGEDAAAGEAVLAPVVTP